MRKVFIVLVLTLIVTKVFSQTVTNADGTIKVRANVAIMVEGRTFAFNNGKPEKVANNGHVLTLKNALYALCIEKFQNYSFGVVNRDNAAFNQVKELIEENKLEDYLNGFSVQAKGQGADYIYLVDITRYIEDNAVDQLEIATRFINIATNFGYHHVYRSDAVRLNDEDNMRKVSEKMAHELSTTLENQILALFPEQYYVAKADGKKWSLGAYQPNGKILETDKFYAFKFRKENIQLGNNTFPIQVMDRIALGEEPSVNGGYLQIKVNKPLNDFSDVVLFRNLSEPVFMGSNQIPITFWGLNYDLNSYEGLCKRRINNAVYSAITRHVGLQLIEHEHLAEVKKERDLQKGEEFIDGHVVEQMKSFGAQYLLKLEGFSREGLRVSFKMSLISVAENRAIRSLNITSSIDNVENEMYKQICERFTYPCTIKVIDKNTVKMSSTITLQSGMRCILELNKAIKNPMTGEISYSKSDLCKVELKEYHANQSDMSIVEVFDKENMKDLEKWAASGNVFFYIDSSKIESNVQNKSAVQTEIKKEKQVEKRKSTFKSIGKSLLKNATIKTE